MESSSISRRKKRKRYCFVPGCTSGYPTNVNKISLFLAPKDSELLKLWAEAIPESNKALDESSSVCELHFDPRFIERYYRTTIQGKEILTPRGRPSLHQGAIPSIFSNSPEYVSEVLARKRQLPEEWEEIELPSKKGDYSECSNSSLDDDVQPLVALTPEVVYLTPLEQLCTVVLPTKYWVQIKYERSVDTICFALWSSYSADNIMDKKVTVKSVSDKYLCTVHFKDVLVSENEISSTNDLQRLIDEANSHHICVGAGKLNEFTHLTFKDTVIIGQILRSNKCSGTVEKVNTKCTSCSYRRRLLLNQRTYHKTSKKGSMPEPQDICVASLIIGNDFESDV